MITCSLCAKQRSAKEVIGAMERKGFKRSNVFVEPGLCLECAMPMTAMIKKANQKRLEQMRTNVKA